MLQFELLEDVPSLTIDGRAKRWVVVRPAGAQTGILLARADGEHQARAVAADVTFVSAPRIEPYGKIAVFLDLEGNRWDLLEPADEAPTG